MRGFDDGVSGAPDGGDERTFARPHQAAGRQVDFPPGADFGLLGVGETAIEGLLEGDDVLNTAAACRALGASVARIGEGSWRVRGCGVGSLLEPREDSRFRQFRHRHAADDGRRRRPRHRGAL